MICNSSSTLEGIVEPLRPGSLRAQKRLLDGLVLRLDGLSEGQVRHGVFVPNPDAGLRVERRQALQAVVHHHRVALEDASAAGDKEGVAGEHVVSEVVGDRPGGVTGDEEDARLMMSDMDDVAVVEPLRLPKDATVIGAVSIDLEVRERLEQLLVAAGVIPVVVGVEDGVQPIPTTSRTAPPRSGRSRRWFRCRAAQQIGVAVLEAGMGSLKLAQTSSSEVHQVGRRVRAKRTQLAAKQCQKGNLSARSS